MITADDAARRQRQVFGIRRDEQRETVIRQRLPFFAGGAAEFCFIKRQGGRYRIRRWYWISWACKCRWASCIRNHGPGQGQLPMSTIKAPGHRNLTHETVTVRR